ncbi:uncharacterized protein B0H64DRAFT_371906 [Chaetomium fimeti]|uniref:Uncharacterized protein n=1 Tax=Chaetomium fimeti TaxID=1854472 RepID=A0AAE0HNR1_9PEZI|nr:hypothetical protein B0H64DRAFT_371906 [Chaetomium fimeti]
MSTSEGGNNFVMHASAIDFIKRYTYRDYYSQAENRPEGLADGEPVLRQRVDRCIDMRRQALLCQGNVGIVTANWVEPSGIYPDYRTEHKCRRFRQRLSSGRTSTPLRLTSLSLARIPSFRRARRNLGGFAWDGLRGETTSSMTNGSQKSRYISAMK